MNKKELEKAAAWGKRQRTGGKFSPPDRLPNEEPITEKQVQYILKITTNGVDVKQLRELGKWQASAFIDYLKEQKALFTQQCVDKYSRKKSGCGCLGAIILFIGITSVVVLASCSMR